MNSGISIIIPIYNEASSLRQLFAAIAAQTLLPHEVIFVDSGSIDGSITMIREFAGTGINNFAVSLLMNPGGFPGANRNRGIKAAQSEWIAFLDGGIIPETNWLEKLLQCVNSRNLKTVYGQCQFDAGTAFQKAVCAVSYGCGAVHPVLPASLFHWSIFESVGLFREDLRAAEDLLWLRSLEKELGPRQVCASALVYYRNFPSNFIQLIQKWWRYERHGVVSGIVTSKQIFFNIALLIFFISILSLFPFITIITATSLIIVRGLVSPIRRSVSWRWWKGSFPSLLIAIAVCFTRDVTKIFAYVFFLPAIFTTFKDQST